MKQALELDPLSHAINWDAGTVYLYARKYDRAMEALQKTLEMDPSSDTWEKHMKIVNIGYAI